ncbi:splicing factor U2af large subunit A-like [Quercus robur]|uniref:splicing factor U2af large subunit A-like n=1 Tax=Quercus robur TaxID=38942 RepID=UPI0021622633|nr:splicing factor U2af large subunit A-like [Quercus robur]
MIVLCTAADFIADELIDDDDYQDILEDMREECRKLGTLVKIIIPCPQLNDEPSPGVGKLCQALYVNILLCHFCSINKVCLAWLGKEATVHSGTRQHSVYILQFA